MKTKMKKLPHLLVGILVLFCPLFALAYCGDMTEEITIYSIVALFIFLLINIKYFKIAVRNKKLFLIAIFPLILFPFFYSDLSIESVLLFIKSMFSYLFLYYLLVALYGFYYFKKINRSIGLSILKFCISAIVTLIIIYVFMTIASVGIMLSIVGSDLLI